MTTQSSREDEIGDFHRPIRDRQFRRARYPRRKTMSNGNKVLVILNVDDARKAHAARFNAGDEGAVRKAAGLMGMRLGVAKSDKALELARKLPEGKLFDSGKGLVPLVDQDLYYALCGSLTFDQAWMSRGVITGADSSPD